MRSCLCAIIRNGVHFLFEFELLMPARILNGNQIRDQIYADLRGEIAALRAAGVQPGLATVLAGENPASKMYGVGPGELASRAAVNGYYRGVVRTGGRAE
jgi:methylenetetrahydrofolate dehydrogenase (NADP+) / methenyltetrahydrofolate cyclohydrolase